MVEVLIVGGGPAGALSALILARAGVRVLVVDRARFPRDKLCGDTLNPGALRILARHGIDGPVVARGRPIEGMVLTSRSGVRVRGVYGPGVVGRSLVRRELDQMLIDAAIQAGAQFQDGVRVQSAIVDDDATGTPAVRGVTLLARDGRTLRVPAQVTIAADGRRSPLAFALGLAQQPAWPRRWAIGGYFTDVDGLDTVGEMHIRPGHYIGVAPLPEGLTNVCFVTTPGEEPSPTPPGPLALSHRTSEERTGEGKGEAGPAHLRGMSPDAVRRELADPARALTARITSDPLLRERVMRARPVGPVTMLGPLAVDVAVAGMRGLLLAGDAAGFIDPMTGDGLRFALRGAELAAEVAQQCVERPDCDGHLTLTARRAREFAGKYRFNRSVRAIVSSRTAVGAASLGARIAPGILRQMIRYAGDGRAK